MTEDFLRRVLVKDHNQRISWDDIFNTYHITNEGEIINKKELVIFQQSFGGELRSSMKSNSNGTYPNGSMRISLPYNAMNNSSNVAMNMASPKSALIPGSHQNSNHTHFNRSYDANNNTDNNLAMRKSPNKPNMDPRGTFEYNTRMGANYQANTAPIPGATSTSNSGTHNTHIKTENNLTVANGKAERPTRMDIFLKNHMKSLHIHQLVL